MRYILLGLLLMVYDSVAHASYACLEVSEDLLPCNLDRLHRIHVKPFTDRKTRVRNGAVMESLYQAPDGTVVVYKLEGCIPGRLPFILPMCKTEDKIGKPVDVRRIFAFAIDGDPPTAPLIFPEIEAAALYKSSRDLKEKGYDPVISREELDKQVPAKLSKRKKKLMMEDILKQSRKQKSMDFDSMFRKESFKSKHHRRINDIDESEGLKKSTKNRGIEDSDDIPDTKADKFESRAMSEEDGRPPKFFPYERSIPYNPAKFAELVMQANRHSDEMPPYLFPYDKSVPYNPALFGRRTSKVKREDRPQLMKHHNHYANQYIPIEDMSPYDQMRFRKVLAKFRRGRDLKHVDGPEEVDNLLKNHHEYRVPKFFPYEKSVPYDPALFGVLPGGVVRTDQKKEANNHHHEYRAPKFFPYEKSIPYDPALYGDLEKGQRFWPKEQKDWVKTELEIETKNTIKNHHHEYRAPKFFPYEKSIPYDPVLFGHLRGAQDFFNRPSKLTSDEDQEDLMKKTENKLHKREIADQGSEFPYDKALPFNHWKVSEFRRRLEAQSRSLRQGRSAEESM